ncbi:putative protein MJ1638 [Methanothermobacter wolfeii]|uniref:ATPase n=1 Tax=Methanothermobacter wolfeii TaxID=145261 RepID=UPI00092D9740|nr:putative protein MJ1638 [Methanothermobacter wolfeii]
MDKEELAEIIGRIRADIGHDDARVRICDVVLDDETGDLLITAPDRSDKSLIIGKGGWVAGRLREELGAGRVHVEAMTDVSVRRMRVRFALERVKELRESFMATRVLEEPLRMRLDKLSAFNFLSEWDETGVRVGVALSGGVDSSFSLILAKNIGLKPEAFTVDPGTIILPGHVKRGIGRLCSALGVRHEFIEVDFSDFLEEALEGRFHPCGRCSGMIQDAVTGRVKEAGLDTVVFGDLLATGYQSLQVTDGVLRINLPAAFAASKQEVRSVASAFKISGSRVFGCPLLGEVQRRHPHLRHYSIQRVLRETRAGVLEPGEALELVWSICK